MAPSVHDFDYEELSKAPPLGDHLRVTADWADKHIIDKDIAHVVKLGDKKLGALPFDVSLFGVLHISGTLDVTSLDVNITVYIHIPLLGKVNLGSIHGGLKEGLTLQVGVSKVASGTIHFHLEDGKEVFADIKLDTRVGKWDKSVRLFTIPH